ncbi:MAG TPA: DUF4145 domain-containing protein [Thermoanaerobaculia bacterium]|nr:DUF4145 domain-containing protein [Thermoanaerobaculia bacterium]
MAVSYVHCHRCGNTTKHESLAVRKVDENVGEGITSFSWRNTYEVLECCGCGALCLCVTYLDLDDREEVHYFPAPISRPLPHWRWQVPDELRELLEEIYAALQIGAPRLALMGTRALIDMVAVREAGDVGTFTAKVAALEQRGFVSKRNSDVLAVALDAGNAAAHRGFKPEIDVLLAVIDIVENIVQAIYHLPHRASRVQRETPPRTRVH